MVPWGPWWSWTQLKGRRKLQPGDFVLSASPLFWVPSNPQWLWRNHPQLFRRLLKNSRKLARLTTITKVIKRSRSIPIFCHWETPARRLCSATWRHKFDSVEVKDCKSVTGRCVPICADIFWGQTPQTRFVSQAVECDRIFDTAEQLWRHCDHLLGRNIGERVFH